MKRVLLTLVAVVLGLAFFIELCREQSIRIGREAQVQHSCWSRGGDVLRDLYGELQCREPVRVIR